MRRGGGCGGRLAIALVSSQEDPNSFHDNGMDDRASLFLELGCFFGGQLNICFLFFVGREEKGAGP